MSNSDQFTDSEELQVQILAFMLQNHDFCDIAADALKNEMFANHALRWFYEKLAQAEIRLTKATLKHEMLQAVKAKAIREDDISSFGTYYKRVCMGTVPAEEEYIRKHLGTFIRTQSTKLAVLESLDLIKENRWEEIAEKVSTATTAGLKMESMGTNYFEDPEKRIMERINRDVDRVVPTGIPELDDLLAGGLRHKQLGLVAGATGRGKTIALEWFGKQALVAGETVLYISLEIPEEDIAFRYDALFSQVPAREISSRAEDVVRNIKLQKGRFDNRLFIKEYPADSVTVNNIKTYYKQLCQTGVRPGVVIVDYLDLIAPHRIYNDTYQELDAITKALHGFAKEYDIAVWTATQLNRGGITNENPDESSVAGAIAKLFTVDVAIFLAQNNAEREDDMLRLLVTKNRSGRAGRTVRIDTDYSRFTLLRQISEDLSQASPDEPSEEDS